MTPSDRSPEEENHMSGRAVKTTRTPQDFGSPGKNQAAELLGLVARFYLATGIVCGLATPLLGAAWMQTIITGSVLALLGLAILVLLRRGNVSASAWISLVGGWSILTANTATSGGLFTPLSWSYFLLVFLAGSLMGPFAAGFAAFISFLTMLGFTLAQQAGYLPYANLSPGMTWSVAVAVLATFTIMVRKSLSIANRQAERERQDRETLDKQSKEWEILADTLTRRNSERTAEISRYLLYLQASGDLNQTLHAQPDPQRLMEQIVDLIKERFGLYYVGLFLVDGSANWAILQAGTGETGQVMLARKHRIEVGMGMIGWCIANGRPRVAADVSADATHVVPSELPLTRSEAAIPMRSLGKVIGALSVLSTRPNDFTHELMTVLQSIADMVGSALENKKLLEDKHTQTEEKSHAGGLEERQIWSDAVGGSAKGYLYDRLSISPVLGEDNPEIRMVRQSGKTMISAQPGAPSVFVPMRIRAQVVGVLAFRKTRLGEPWSRREIELLEKLTDQLGETLDGARLYQSIQRQAAREQLVSELTTKMRETLDVDTVLRTAADEIYRTLQLEHVSVELMESHANYGHLPEAGNRA